MRQVSFRVPVALAWLCCVAGGLRPAAADVTNIRADVIAEVRQFFNGTEVQSDFAQESLPGTALLPPVTARALLDQLSQTSSVIGAGQVKTVFNQPFLTGLFAPNDVGMDVGAFGDDPMTTWMARGLAIETRSVNISSDEVGGLAVDMTARLRSRLVISGVLLITSLDPARDLAGASSRLHLSVTKQHTAVGSGVLVSGDVTLLGDSAGMVTLQSQGVFVNIALPVLDLTGSIPGIPLVKAVVFPGIGIPYEYDVLVGEDFELELRFEAEVHTLPSGVGAAAVFGLPQVGLDAIFSRVKKDDRGAALVRLIAEHVDTTGRSYRDDGSGTSSVFPLGSVCGAFGAPAAGFAALALCGAGCIGGIRRRRLVRSRRRSAS